MSKARKYKKQLFSRAPSALFLTCPQVNQGWGEKDERREREKKKKKRRIAVKNNESRKSVNTEGFER